MAAPSLAVRGFNAGLDRKSQMTAHALGRIVSIVGLLLIPGLGGEADASDTPPGMLAIGKPYSCSLQQQMLSGAFDTSSVSNAPMLAFSFFDSSGVLRAQEYVLGPSGVHFRGVLSNSLIPSTAITFDRASCQLWDVVNPEVLAIGRVSCSDAGLIHTDIGAIATLRQFAVYDRAVTLEVTVGALKPSDIYGTVDLGSWRVFAKARNGIRAEVAVDGMEPRTIRLNLVGLSPGSQVIEYGTYDVTYKNADSNAPSGRICFDANQAK
jgi:hypothetical protein